MLQSDDGLQNRWYRFNGGRNSEVLQGRCVEKFGKCTTLSAGWMMEKHPTGSIHTVYRCRYLSSFTSSNSSYCCYQAAAGYLKAI